MKIVKNKIECWLAELNSTGDIGVGIEDVLPIFEQTEVWFDCPTEAWDWFVNYQISGCGNLTAAQVVKQQGGEGVIAIELYIKSKKLGGFE